MSDSLQRSCDAILEKVTTGEARVPGVVAMVTDKRSNIYEGAAGVRDLSTGDPMTL